MEQNGNMDLLKAIDELFSSETAAADELLRIFANQHDDESVREHILGHVQVVGQGEGAVKEKENGGFESMWECISVLLGSRCEHMQLMSTVLRDASRKEEELRLYSDRERELHDRIHVLEERLRETVTEEDWIEAKEESSLLRDQMSKLNEKFEFINRNNNQNSTERQRLQMENEDLLLKLKNYEISSPQIFNSIESKSQVDETEALKKVIVEQKEMIRTLQSKLSGSSNIASDSVTEGKRDQTYGNYENNSYAFKGELHGDPHHAITNDKSVDDLQRKNSIDNNQDYDAFTVDVDNEDDNVDDFATTKEFLSAGDNLRTSVIVSQGMKEFFSKSEAASERESIDTQDTHKTETISGEVVYPLDNFFSSSIPFQSTNNGESVLSTELTQKERRRTVTFKDELPNETENDSGATMYDIPERSSGNAFASAMYRRASVLTD